MTTDVTQALKDTENLLRGVIELRLSESFGSDWIASCGATEDRIQRWRERQNSEKARLASGSLKEGLLFYADFYDLFPVLKKHWSLFSGIFGDLRTMEVFLLELGKLRDPDAHRRELLPHQKSLAAGIAGELRTKMIKWRSKMETGKDYFPRIESALDNYGNSFDLRTEPDVFTKTVLRPGVTVDISVTASDPLGEQLKFRLCADCRDKGDWADTHEFSHRIEERDIGKLYCLKIEIASGRKYHAFFDSDDSVSFYYTVLPAGIG